MRENVFVPARAVEVAPAIAGEGFTVPFGVGTVAAMGCLFGGQAGAANRAVSTGKGGDVKDRFKRWLFRGVVAAIWIAAGYYALFGGEYDVLELQELQEERDAVASRLDSISHRADSVKAWADSLESDTLAIQRVAREDHGLIREGEVLYRFIPSGDSTGS